MKQVDIMDALAKLQAGRVTPNLSKKEKIEKARIICELYSLGEYTLESCCKACGVNHYTFYNWVQPSLTEAQIEDGSEVRKGFVQEVHDLYKDSKNTNEINYMILAKNVAREGLIKKGRGLEYEEVTTQVEIDKEGNSKPVSIRKVNKVILPDTTALIFLAKNVDSDTFKDRVETVHSGKIQTGTGLEHLTDAELAEKKLELEAAMSKEFGV